MNAARSLLRQSLVLNSDQLDRRIAVGAGFKFLGMALRTLLTIGSTAVLARLLVPADFGYMAMASVVTEFAGLFASFGFTNILIQRRRITRLQIDTVFWASLALGLGLGAAVVAASYLAGALYDDARVGPVLRVLALNFVLGALGNVPWIVMARMMRFKAEFWIQIGGAAVRAAVGIGCAWAGWGVYSLAWAGVAGMLASTAAGLAYVSYRPRLRFHWPLIRNTWRTTSSYFGGSLLYYAQTNLDLFLIGQQLGATALGYYQNARSLTDEIRARIAMPIQHVMFPAFSIVQTDPTRAQQLLMRTSRLLVAVVVPISLAMAANAHELVQVLYGPQWQPMTPALALLAASASVRAATAVASPVFYAADRAGLALRYGVIGTVLFLLLLAVALPFGLNAVAAAVASSSMYSLIACHAGFRLVGLGWKDMLQAMAAPFLAGAAIWPATLAMRQWTEPLSPWPLLRLLVHVAAGFGIYLACLHLQSRQYWLDARAAMSRLAVRR